eukprot:scaffold182792_cov26-Tisochrysis_lutea.AAC.2
MGRRLVPSSAQAPIPLGAARAWRSTLAPASGHGLSTQYPNLESQWARRARCTHSPAMAITPTDSTKFILSSAMAHGGQLTFKYLMLGCDGARRRGSSLLGPHPAEGGPPVPMD